MEKDKYVGKGWENKYGISVQVNLKELQSLPVDNYGNVRIYVGKRKSPDEKSKATHWVKEQKPFEKNDQPKDDLPF